MSKIQIKPRKSFYEDDNEVLHYRISWYDSDLVVVLNDEEGSVD